VIVVPIDLPGTAPEVGATLVRLAAVLGDAVCLVAGEPDDARVAELGATGADRVVWVDLPDGRWPGVAPAVRALATLVGREDLVLVPATRTGTEVAARLALRLGRPLSTAAESLARDGDGLVLSSSAFTSTWTVSTHAPLASVVSVATTAAPPTAGPEAASGSTTVERLDVDLSADPREPVVVSVAPKPAGRGPRLTDAAVVVSGGRGTDGDFRPLEELAALVGGAVGSSRVAVDLGWAGAERQVGQTGISVAPEVYIAAGISGAIQHLAGMNLARSVVAINTDPDAPIFRACDLGIVGDLHTVLAEAVDLLRNLRRTPAA